jgi:methylenetetrahydrofolate reductase (NADPH)
MIVERIQREHALTTLAHLTCVNHTREQVGALLDRIQRLGCRNILALRGDPPDGGRFQPTAGGFRYAAELVAFTRQRAGEFSIGVAGFPEGHIACAEGKLADWNHLKNKIDAGADFVITQLFFDNTDFLALRDFLVKAGVRVPVVPGMIAILSASQIKRFTQLCGARLPQPLAARLEQLEQDDAAAAEFGIEYASRQCDQLLREGVPGFHFYTLNKARSTLQVLKNVGLA